MTINVAVVCRAKGFDDTRLKLGWWSYAVPDLDWTFYPTVDGQTVDKNALAERGHDLIVWEDWVWNTWTGTAPIPIYAVIVDSNTSPRRRRNYKDRAAHADVFLIDQDKLKYFKALEKPTYRWSYGVNERVFRPEQKLVDVGYHVQYTDERSQLHEYLRTWAAHNTQWRVTMGGNMPMPQYVHHVNQARILVHKRTHEQCRSHRYFDALAAGCCLIADRGWSIEGDQFEPGYHYLEWADHTDLTAQIERLLDSGQWAKTANVGRAFVLANHTWAHRAAEFVDIAEQVHAGI